MADMDVEQMFEEKRVAFEGVEGEGAEVREAVQQEETAGHDTGRTLDAAVSALVGGEVAGVKGVCKSCGLTEAEAESGAGDSVDGAGGVSYEGDVVCGDAAEGAVEGDGSAGRATGSCRGELMLESGELG